MRNLDKYLLKRNLKIKRIALKLQQKLNNKQRLQRGSDLKEEYRKLKETLTGEIGVY